MLHKNFQKYLDQIQEFLSYNIKLRSKNSYELYSMAKTDETLVYLNIPASAIVQTIISKKVNIRTQGNKKLKNNIKFNNSCIWRKVSTFIYL